MNYESVTNGNMVAYVAKCVEVLKLRNKLSKYNQCQCHVFLKLFS
jgi:hypothetical protein